MLSLKLVYWYQYTSIIIYNVKSVLQIITVVHVWLHCSQELIIIIIIIIIMSCIISISSLIIVLINYRLDYNLFLLIRSDLWH
jgi:hypothetical protein